MVRILSSTLKLFSIIVLAIVLAGGSIWFFNYWQDQQRSAELGRPVTVEITDDDDSGSVAEKLTDSDLVRYGFYFETRMRFSGVELSPGVYTLRIGMSVPEIINEITVKDAGSGNAEAETAGTVAPKSFQVTFIEGQRIEENGSVLEQAGMPNGSADYVAAASDADAYRSSYSFLDSVPQGASLEGFLFPDTYTVGQNAVASDVIGLQLSNFEAKFTPEMIAQAQAAGLSIYEVVTLASIVEREAAIPEERPQIAAVYLNRIADGMPLQADPVQQYGVGTAEKWWPTLNTELLAKSKETAYDTYDTEGLPPGPIANPGFASIQAVLQPADVPYLYFVTTGDESGAHLFSTTYEEHLEKMCQEHPEYEDCGGGGSLPLSSPLADRVRWGRELAG